jgi:hypothetical protein
MAAIDLPPGIVCSVVREESGDRVQIRGRVVSPRDLQGTYALHIRRSGPSGSSTVNQNGAFAAPADRETFLGQASFNLEPGVTLQTDLTLRVGDNIRTCRNGEGDSR